MYVIVMRDSLSVLRERWWAMLRVALVSIPIFLVIGLIGSFFIGKMVVNAASRGVEQTTSSMNSQLAQAANTNFAAGSTGAATTESTTAGAVPAASTPITNANTQTLHVDIPHDPVGIIKLLGPSAVGFLLYMLVLLAVGSLVHAAMVRGAAYDEGIGAAAAGAWASIRQLGAQQGVLQAAGLVGMLLCVLPSLVLGGFGSFLGGLGEIALFVVFLPASMLVVADCALDDDPTGDLLPRRSIRAFRRNLVPALLIGLSLVGVSLVASLLAAILIGLLLLPVVALWSVALTVAMHQNMSDDPPRPGEGDPGSPDEGSDALALVGGGAPVHGAMTPGEQASEPVHAVLNGTTDPGGAVSGGWLQVPSAGQVTLQVQPAGAGLVVHVADANGTWLSTVPGVDARGATTFAIAPGVWWVNVGVASGVAVAWRIDCWLPPGSAVPVAA